MTTEEDCAPGSGGRWGWISSDSRIGALPELGGILLGNCSWLGAWVVVLPESGSKALKVLT